MEIAHGLERAQAFQAGREHDEEADYELEYSIDEKS